MGDIDKTKTKLTELERFAGSIFATKAALAEFRGYTMLQTADDVYSEAIGRLRSVYQALDLTEFDATVVVNSKALYHMLPEFLPPIDRQYTIRFFTQPPKRWRDSKGKYRMISLPAGIDEQFRLFHNTCVKFKQLADAVDLALFDEQRRKHNVTVPKALDNAIVNYVRLVSTATLSAI